MIIPKTPLVMINKIKQFERPVLFLGIIVLLILLLSKSEIKKGKVETLQLHPPINQEQNDIFEQRITVTSRYINYFEHYCAQSKKDQMPEIIVKDGWKISFLKGVEDCLAIGIDKNTNQLLIDTPIILPLRELPEEFERRWSIYAKYQQENAVLFEDTLKIILESFRIY